MRSDDGCLLWISKPEYNHDYGNLLYRIAHTLLFPHSSWRRTQLWHTFLPQIELLSYYPSYQLASA